MKNLLLKGDNIHAMQWLLQSGYEGKIDLVYIDPPFGTGGKFCVDFDGRVSTISKSNHSQLAYNDTLVGSEFIEFLRKRIVLIHKLLSDSGSLYLHIDYKIGHYVKVMLDEVFGIDNFRNDITRIKCNPKNFERIGYGNIKDLILFYSKGKNPIWNNPKFETNEQDIAKLYPKVDNQGRHYTTVPIHAPGESKNSSNAIFKGLLPPQGRHWRCSVDELERLDANGLLEWSVNGVPRKINYADEHIMRKAQDVWSNFKDPQHPIYPTEKNLEMLKFIINASSSENSIILDCFCGSGSTLLAAENCGRGWIGIDQSEIAINTTKKRFIEGSYSFIEISNLQ